MNAIPRRLQAKPGGWRGWRGRHVLLGLLGVCALALVVWTGPEAAMRLQAPMPYVVATLVNVGALIVSWLMARRGRVPESPAVGEQTASATVVDGVQAHRRVRLGLYTVLVALGCNALLQIWQAHRSDQARQAEAVAIELAAVQRMLSQRIGRLAVAAANSETPAAVAELSAALDRADLDAQRLHALMQGQGLLPRAQDDALQQAWSHWVQRRTQLVASGRALTRNQQTTEQLLAAGEARLHAEAEAALGAAQSLLDGLHDVVQQRHAATLAQIQTWAVLNMLLLAALAVSAVEPAVRAVKRQHRSLARQTAQMQRLALVAERTTNMVLIADPQHHIVWVNEAFTRVTGYAAHEAIGRTAQSMLGMAAVDADGVRRVQTSLAGGQALRAPLRSRTKDGRALWLDLDLQPLTDDTGAPEGVVGVAADITALTLAQAELRVAAIAFDALDGIVITDPEQNILRVNPAFTRITGYSAAEAVGHKTGQLLRSGRHERSFYEAMWTVLVRDHHWQGEVWNQRKNGEVYPQWMTITAVVDDQGRTANYVAVFSDITEKKRADETIHTLAFYDPLTKLPNRRLLRDRIQDAVSAAAGQTRHAAVLFIDLDNFKELNDSRGHDVGDLLLVDVARRLSGCVRANDTVARQGGDEFVILVRDLNPDPERARAQAESIAESIRRELNRPYELAGVQHRSSPSIGINVFRGAEQGVDELLKRADIAMYQAKRAGRNALRFFDPQMYATLEARIALAADLRRALPQHELSLRLQPQVDADGRVFGAEVLLRWAHPQRGLVPPAQFIPLAEESDLILEIGHWVLQQAAERLRSWSTRPNRRHLELSVNVSARQFRKPDFVDTVGALLDQVGLEPGRLKFELTESLVLQDIDDTVQKMTAMRQRGIKFALDDFGTGQSSLAYLTRLPLDQLKVDQSFVSHMTRSRSDAVVVETIIGMANNLGIEIIAEGVETEEQRQLLHRHGCRRYQGYLFGKPVLLAEFEQLLDDAEVVGG